MTDQIAVRPSLSGGNDGMAGAMHMEEANSESDMRGHVVWFTKWPSSARMHRNAWLERSTIGKDFDACPWSDLSGE